MSCMLYILKLGLKPYMRLSISGEGSKYYMKDIFLIIMLLNRLILIFYDILISQSDSNLKIKNYFCEHSFA